MAFLENVNNWAEQFDAWNWAVTFEGKALEKQTLEEWEQLYDFFGDGVDFLRGLFNIMDREIWGEQGKYDLKEVWGYYRKLDEKTDILSEIFWELGVRELFRQHWELRNDLSMRVSDKNDYLKETTKINQKHLDKLEKRIRAKNGKFQMVRHQIAKQLQL